MKKIAIINGPNLNLLGVREKTIYGQQSLADINQHLAEIYKNDAILTFFQSNCEGAIIDYLHLLRDTDGIVINPGGLTHYSVALRDALLAIKTPAIEVHLSNIYAREEFRKNSLISDICLGTISGLGPLGYELAIRSLL